MLFSSCAVRETTSPYYCLSCRLVLPLHSQYPVRLDSKNAMGFDYVFVSYSPDYANVRDKMIYASTRATLKTAFGVQVCLCVLWGMHKKDTHLTEMISFSLLVHQGRAFWYCAGELPFEHWGT